ncbi:MAG: OsmC family protein [Cyclobacteriaceae bacterium]
MKISATVENSLHQHTALVCTNDQVRELAIPAKTEGQGASVNGGELLFLALATCFCNDIYREAAKRNISITLVFVEASGEFSAEGAPGYNITYQARVSGDASDAELAALIKYTDQMAEIQNTLRAGVNVTLIE